MQKSITKDLRGRFSTILQSVRSYVADVGLSDSALRAMCLSSAELVPTSAVKTKRRDHASRI